MGSSSVAPAAYVGVDSGGTRTNVAVRIVGEKRPQTYEVPACLSGALPPELLATTMRTILGRLHRVAAKLKDRPVYVWISAAGFTPWTHGAFREAMSMLIPDLLDGGIVRAAAANDGVSLLLGSDDADSVVIAGTGSTVITRSHDRSLRQSGGHEWVACDQGSGFWIALKGIRQAYKDFEAGFADSALLTRMCKMYGAVGDRGVIERLRYLAVTTEDTKKEIARFAAEVCAAAERGDADAQDIVKDEAEELADLTAGALRRTLGTERLATGVTLVQCGSLLGNDFYRSLFDAHLRNRLRLHDNRDAQLTSHHVGVGLDAAVNLAQKLAASVSFDEIGDDFAPAIVDR